MKTREQYEQIAREIAAVYAKNAATYADVDIIHQFAKEFMTISVAEPKQQ